MSKRRSKDWIQIKRKKTTLLQRAARSFGRLTRQARSLISGKTPRKVKHRQTR